MTWHTLRQCEVLETGVCIAFDGHVSTTESVAESELGDEADEFDDSND